MWNKVSLFKLQKIIRYEIVATWRCAATVIMLLLLQHQIHTEAMLLGFFLYTVAYSVIQPRFSTSTVAKHILMWGPIDELDFPCRGPNPIEQTDEVQLQALRGTHHLVCKGHTYGICKAIFRCYDIPSPLIPVFCWRGNRPCGAVGWYK